MALDPTSREANFKDSVKKFFIDNLHTTEQIHLSFDRSFNSPEASGSNKTTKWVAISFGQINASKLTEAFVTIFCCTREDKEGYQLSRLRDTVYGYLTDGTQDDGCRRIVLYKSNETPWAAIGAMRVYIEMESSVMVAEDETKFKMITVKLIWGAKP